MQNTINGTLIPKHARHPNRSISTPPTTGAHTSPTACEPFTSPLQNANLLNGKLRRRTNIVPPATALVPTPATALPTTNIFEEAAKVQVTDPRRKMDRPERKMDLVEKMVYSLPKKKMEAERVRP
jgi:hypothetical protein